MSDPGDYATVGAARGEAYIPLDHPIAKARTEANLRMLRDLIANSDRHPHLYGDTRRVHEARIQAKGRIAARKLRHALNESWAVPLLNWLTRNLP